MLTRRPPRPAALLLAGLVVALSACGPAGGSGDGGGDTTGTRAPGSAAGPQALPVRDDLVDPQIVAWRDWRAVDDRTLEVSVSAGSPDCYGAAPEVVESETAVRVRVRVGVRPDLAGRECPAIAVESVVAVRLAAPLGTRTVEHLS